MNHWLGQEVPGMLRDSQKESVNMSEQRTRTEEFQVSGDKLIEKIKEIIHSGNIRRIKIANEEGKPLIDIPLTLGVVGVILVPQMAAIGAIAAIVTKCTITVEKIEEEG